MPTLTSSPPRFPSPRLRLRLQPTDSTATKAGGAILNSLVFVAFITFATFVIFFLFKYNCTRVIWGYMGFSGLLIFGILGEARCQPRQCVSNAVCDN
jgi:hypothetical protein